jgi:site-specific DNA-methyltransferase (adenine-specific)
VKPYYSDESVTLYLGDCREILPTLKADFIFADPPYGVQFKYGVHDDKREGYEALIREWFAVMKAERVCVTPGIDNLCLWPQPRWALAWLKMNSMGANRLSGPKTVSRNLWEPILWYGNYPIHPPSRDTLKAPLGEGDAGSGHPCPKPYLLMTQIVSMSAEADLIVDPFAGSGTTLRAAKDMNRRAIGIEIEEKYCEGIARRMAQSVMQFGAS